MFSYQITIRPTHGKSVIEMEIQSWDQGTINCAILRSGMGRSGDPRRNWEGMGERERGRERTIEMQEVYILPLKKPGLRHLSRL